MAPVHPATLIHAVRRTGHLLFATVRTIPIEKEHASLFLARALFQVAVVAFCCRDIKREATPRRLQAHPDA